MRLITILHLFWCQISLLYSPRFLISWYNEAQGFNWHASTNEIYDSQGNWRAGCCSHANLARPIARQAFHLGFAVDFLSDAIGTLAVQNSAGAISAQDLLPVGDGDPGNALCQVDRDW